MYLYCKAGKLSSFHTHQLHLIWCSLPANAAARDKILCINTFNINISMFLQQDMPLQLKAAWHQHPQFWGPITYVWKPNFVRWPNKVRVNFLQGPPCSQPWRWAKVLMLPRYICSYHVTEANRFAICLLYLSLLTIILGCSQITI